MHGWQSDFLPPGTPVLTVLLIVATVIVSVRAFKDGHLRDRLIFSPERILAGKEWHRLVTSAFLHADVQHLAMNMITLFLFGRGIEFAYGGGQLLLFYFASVIGGNLLSLYLHRHHEYFALGASGGTCGVLFVSIFLLPGGGIGSLFLPFTIPSWLYAILFLIFEFRGARLQRDNIGHDAHLGGAIIGLLTATAMYPRIVIWSPWLYATVMTLSIAMFISLWKNSLHLPLSAFFDATSIKPKRPAKAKFNQPTEEEIDLILDKVGRNGLHSLNQKERDLLRRASKK